MIEAKMMDKSELDELIRVYLTDGDGQCASDTEEVLLEALQHIAYLEEYKEHGWQLLKEENERLKQENKELNTEIEQLREVMKSDTTTD